MRVKEHLISRALVQSCIGRMGGPNTRSSEGTCAEPTRQECRFDRMVEWRVAQKQKLSVCRPNTTQSKQPLEGIDRRDVEWGEVTQVAR